MDIVARWINLRIDENGYVNATLNSSCTIDDRSATGTVGMDLPESFVEELQKVIEKQGSLSDMEARLKLAQSIQADKPGEPGEKRIHLDGSLRVKPSIEVEKK